ncbi:hypothetical protein Fcan01_24986 [Folsomia candida]|uniref:Uncharacterized protein n=1 Tax=Folsomia candida TaxID=158441 RepID=A0A226D625_FOLCA|nr:hypothetical protein Fcan01_24986 [Folsomia candida]
MSFRDVNLVSTTIFMPKYESLILSMHKVNNFPALDTLRARVSTCRLSFIFLDAEIKNPIHSFENRVEHWIKVASKYYFDYKEIWRFPTKDYSTPNTDAVITVVINKSELPQLAVSTFQQPLYHYLSVIVPLPSEKLEMCIPQLKTTLGVPLAPMACMNQVSLSEGNYLSLVKKQTLHWEEWCTLDVKESQSTPATVNTDLLLTTIATSFNQLALQIFSKANTSVIKHLHCSFLRMKHVQLELNAANQPDTDIVLDVTLIQTDVERYHFLTCYAEPYITLHFYLSPFQPEIWVVLATTVSAIIVLGTLVQSSFSLLKQQSFSTWIYVLGSLFEETGFMPSRIEKHTFFRILLGTWGIMSVVLTNGYNGIMISELNSPRRQFHPESFNQLDCNSTFKIVQKYGNAKEINLSESTKEQIKAESMIWAFEFFSFLSEISSLSTLVPLNSVLTEKADINTTNLDTACYRLLSAFDPSNQDRFLPEFLGVLLNLAIGYSSSLATTHCLGN